MTKTNLQKTAEELRSISLTLMEQVRASKQNAQNNLNTLRTLETQVRQRVKDEQVRALNEAAAAESAAAAQTQPEARGKWVVPQAEGAAFSPITEETPTQPQTTPQPPPLEAAAPAPEPAAPVMEAPETPAAPAPQRPQRPAIDRGQRPLVGERSPRPRAEGDRPFADRRPAGDRPFGDRPAGDRPYAQRPAGDRPYAQRPAGDRPFGDRPAGDRPYAQRPAGDRPFNNGPRPAGDRPFNNGPRPAGDRPFNNDPRPAGDRPYNNGPRPAGDRPYGQRPAGDRPYGQRPAGDRPMGPRPAAGGPGIGRTIAKELTPIQEKTSSYNPNKKLYEREKANQEHGVKSKKQLMRQQAPSFSDREFMGKRHKPRREMGIERRVIENAVVNSERVAIKVLAEKIGVPGAQIVKKLFLLGIVATINQEIDFDTASLIASEAHVTLEYRPDKSYEDVMMDNYSKEADDGSQPRPPVVTVMGHVDHGKTSLLDVIRKTRVTETEAGGITQHIGAYIVNVNGQSITFLDTPGHEAFTSMRSRGAQVTDIAILVVAADDGVMPQTVEAINHAKAAKVPIMIAINKMDLPAANPDRVRQELSEYGIISEQWGGDNIIVEVSAATHMGIDKLLESILLVAEMEDLRANYDAKATGTVIEARLDRGRGPVATVLVNNGTLRIGDTVVAGAASGHVRAMLSDTGAKVEEATPSMPVEVIGFSEVPDAGDILHCVDDDKLARRVAEERSDKIKIDRMKLASRVSLDDLYDKISEGEMKSLNIIIKGDVQGSVEAVKQALEKLSNEQVKIDTIHYAVGAITEGDVMLAATSNAIVIGFNVRPDANGRMAAEREKVDVRLYRIIYKAVEDMEKALKGMLAPEFKEIVMGHAQVRSVFQITGVGAVAGSYVADGTIRRNAKVRILRDSVVVFEGVLSSLKRFKDDAREVASGYECGISIQGYNDIKENDVIEAYVLEQIER